jgi:hypothetical protein
VGVSVWQHPIISDPKKAQNFCQNKKGLIVKPHTLNIKRPLCTLADFRDFFERN